MLVYHIAFTVLHHHSNLAEFKNTLLAKFIMTKQQNRLVSLNKSANAFLPSLTRGLWEPP